MMSSLPVRRYYVLQRRLDNDYGKADYAEAIHYEARVLAGTGDGQPQWFAAALAAALTPIINELSGIKTELTDVKTELTNVKTEVANLKTEVIGLARKQADLMRTFAKGYGPNTALHIVPFPDGRYPSECGLPPLDTIAAVENVSTQDRNQYLQHYYGEARGSTAQRKELLLKALGSQIRMKE